LSVNARVFAAGGADTMRGETIFNLESGLPMDLSACTETLRARMATASGLNATLKFDCGSDGAVFLDGKSVPGTVSKDKVDADCAVAMKLQRFV
jgi:hypothetical protein